MEKDKCCNFYGSQCEKYLLYYGEGIFFKKIYTSSNQHTDQKITN